jgi:hypothetical protein
VTAESSNAQILELGPADIAVYFYRQCQRPVDETGCNQWAIVVDEHGALSRHQSRVIRVPWEALLKMPELHFRSNPYDGHRDRIARFFLDHVKLHDHFEAGEKALLQGNLQPFEWGRLFPSRPTYASDFEFDQAWRDVLEKARPMDTIFAAREDDIMSRLVVWTTQGPFSHVATYLGDGEIWESVTSGLRRGKLTDLYKSRRIWVAVYRHIQHTEREFSFDEAERIAADVAAKYKDGYNWFQAVRHGLMSFRGAHEDAEVPNSFLYRGSWVLIAQA